MLISRAWAACVKTEYKAGGVLPCMGYIGMCRCEGYGFQALWDKVFKSESLGLE